MTVLCVKSTSDEEVVKRGVVKVGHFYIVIDEKRHKDLQSGLGYELAEDPGYCYDSGLFSVCPDDGDEELEDDLELQDSEEY